jgi:hypothetical protein
VGVEAGDQRLQQRLVRVVVRLGDPDVFALRLAQPAVPLPERAAAVPLVEEGADPGVGRVGREDPLALVRRGVVEEQEFEVAERLAQDAPQATVQVPRVVVVRDDDRDSRQG